MKKQLMLSAAILAGTASFSLAADPADRAAQSGAEAVNQAAQGSQQNQQLQQKDEQDFVRHASSDNQFEIQAAQLVQKNAQSDQVKQLVTRLVEDHQKAQQQLQQMAQAMHVEASDQLDPVCQAKLQEMQKKQGQHLERGFVFDQVGDHTKDILMFQFVANNAQNAQLKQFATQQIPILEEHLKMARTAAEQYVPEARTAGERIRGAGNSIERKAHDLTGSGSGTGNNTSGNKDSSTGTSGTGTSGNNR